MKKECSEIISRRIKKKLGRRKLVFLKILCTKPTMYQNMKIAKIGKLFLHRFQKIAHFFWTKNPIWPLLIEEGRGWSLHVVN